MCHSHDYQLTALTRNPFFLPKVKVQNNFQGFIDLVGWFFVWGFFLALHPAYTSVLGITEVLMWSS